MNLLSLKFGEGHDGSPLTWKIPTQGNMLACGDDGWKIVPQILSCKNLGDAKLIIIDLHGVEGALSCTPNILASAYNEQGAEWVLGFLQEEFHMRSVNPIESPLIIVCMRGIEQLEQETVDKLWFLMTHGQHVGISFLIASQQHKQLPKYFDRIFDLTLTLNADDESSKKIGVPYGVNYARSTFLMEKFTLPKTEPL